MEQFEMLEREIERALLAGKMPDVDALVVYERFLYDGLKMQPISNGSKLDQ